jgi:hypothetical protein
MKCHLSYRFLNRSGHGLMIASRLDQVYCLVKERFGKFVKNLFLLGCSRPQRHTSVCMGGGGYSGVREACHWTPQDNFRKICLFRAIFTISYHKCLGKPQIPSSFDFQPVSSETRRNWIFS